MHRRKNTITLDGIQPVALTVHQAAHALGVGKDKVYELIKTRGLPVVSLGHGRGMLRVPFASLQDWLKQQEIP